MRIPLFGAYVRLHCLKEDPQVKQKDVHMAHFDWLNPHLP